ncbi:MAG TPA: PDZ domain-containing protein [Thermoanaerobaculia bacterium]
MRSSLCLWLLPVLALGCAKGGEGLGQATVGADFRNAESLRENGVVLQEVLENGPAGRAGLRSDDLILSIDGRPLDNKCALEREIFNRFPGEKVRFAVRRGMESFETEVKLVDARKLYEKACRSGRASGCYLLGGLVAREPDQEKQTYELFRRACEGGSPGGCAELAGQFIEEKGWGSIDDGLLELVRKACDNGNASGCAIFAEVYGARYGGDPVKGPRAKAAWEKACDLGDAASCFNTGWHLEQELGARRDLGRALTFYERACELGMAAGCVNAGFAHERGQGIQADAMRAVRAYRRACEGTPCDTGEPLGCANLGTLYYNGIGVARSYETAGQLFGRACEEGNAQGCTRFADLVTGDGFDPYEIPKWRESLRSACNNEHKEACSWLERNP